MALGGGTFISQNKVLPGAYINFVSAARAGSVIGERGVSAMPFELDWGNESDIFTVERADFEKNALTLFGYDYGNVKLKNIREVFKRARTLLCYRLNGSGVKAANTFATARYSGVRGNDLKTVISSNVDVPASFDVKTLIDNVVVNSQTVVTAAGLKDNDFVTFKPGAVLAVNAGLALTAGTNAAIVAGTAYAAFLSKIESYSFNTLGCPTNDVTVTALFINFTKRLRDELGVKFQTVLPVTATIPDHEGCIVIPNTVNDVGAPAHALVYWTTGAQGACEINKSLTNALYDGEYTINTVYTQSQLEAFIAAGIFAFHKVGTGVRTLDDVNSFTSFTADKTADFGSNQAIRVIDQIANDVALIFNTNYLGVIPNDESGRISLWNDIVKHHKDLEQIRAIENFDPALVIIEEGDTKKSVVISDVVTVTNCMTQLYMTVVVA